MTNDCNLTGQKTGFLLLIAASLWHIRELSSCCQTRKTRTCTQFSSWGVTEWRSLLLLFCPPKTALLVPTSNYLCEADIWEFFCWGVGNVVIRTMLTCIMLFPLYNGVTVFTQIAAPKWTRGRRVICSVLFDSWYYRAGWFMITHWQY